MAIFRIKKDGAWQDEPPGFGYAGMENVIKV